MANHANFAETTLAAAITTTDETSITVTSETSFPSVPFIISIDTECLLVTTVAGTTWTVTRGYESSTAATHLNGVAIYHDWSAGEASAVSHVIIAIEGDSISTGAETKWPQQMGNLSAIFGRGIVHNFAASGETAASMVAEYATQAHTVAPSLPDRGYFFLMAGTNDVSASVAAATIYGNLTTIWAAARTDGFKVIAFTILPSTGFTVGNGKETIRLALNVLIMSDMTLYDGIVCADVLLPDPADETYFVDGVHPTSAGALVLAHAVALALDGLPYYLITVDPYGTTLDHYNLVIDAKDVISLGNITATRDIVGDGLFIGGVEVTATAAELNMADNARSELQAQIDSKLAFVPTNLIANGDFETDTTGWTGTNATLSRETGTPLVGTGSLKILGTGSVPFGYTSVTTVVGHQYVFSCRLKSTAAAGRLCQLMKSGGTAVYSTSTDCSTEITLILTFTADVTTIILRARIQNGIADEILLVDTVRCYDLTAGTTATVAELNYASGVTSAIQTQLTAKLPLAGGTMTGALTTTQLKLSALNTAPANAGSAGTLGELRIVDGYIYVCTATNTWKRVAIATW